MNILISALWNKLVIWKTAKEDRVHYFKGNINILIISNFYNKLMGNEKSDNWWNSPLTPKKLLIIIIWIVVIFYLINIILSIFLMNWVTNWGSSMFKP